MGGRGSASGKSNSGVSTISPSSIGNTATMSGHMPNESVQAIHTRYSSYGVTDPKSAMKAINSYTGSGYHEMRAGKRPNDVKLIDEVVYKSPKYEGTVYRGINVSESYLAELKSNIGGSVNMGKHGPASWSSDVSTAKDFSKHGEKPVNLVFKMENKRGASITNVSKFGSSEGEVLHKSNETCKVKSVRKQGFYYIATLEDSE